MSEAVTTIWSSGLKSVWRILEDARTQAASSGVELTFEVDPAEDPGPSVSWNWHITCTAGEFEVDMMASQDAARFFVEDDNGWFEIATNAQGLPGVLMTRLASLKKPESPTS